MGHDPGHGLLHGIAAVVLWAGGAILLAYAWLDARRHRRAGRVRGATGTLVLAPSDPAPLAHALTILVCTLSLAAGSVHLAAAPSHIEALGLLGWGFVAAATFQASWALAYAIQPSGRLAAIAIIGNAGVVAAWLWSRTIGLPVGPLAGQPEPIAMPDGAATLFQVLLIVALAARGAGIEAALVARLRDVRAFATIAVIPAVGIVFAGTAMAVLLALGHGHGPDGGHAGAAIVPGAAADLGR